MDRAYASGTAGSAPAAPASPSIGYPTAGNPGTGTPATKPGPYWYHQITEELLAIITAAGITPDQGTLTQLASAIQSGKLFSSAAGGTADALTASFSPAIGVLINGISLYVRAGAANATTTPTFTPNSGTIAAKTIIKGAGAALAAGDIAGGGHWIELRYDLTLDRWVLLNPATGVTSQSNVFRKNVVINGDGRIRQAPAATISTVFQYGSADLWLARLSSGVPSAGTIQGVAFPLTPTKSAIAVSALTCTGTGVVDFAHRSEAADTTRLSGKLVTVSALVCHDVGTNINWTIAMRRASAADNFSVVTGLFSSGVVPVLAGVATRISATYTMGVTDGDNGLETLIQANCGTVTGKTLQVTEVQIEEVAANIAPTQFEILPISTITDQVQRFYEVIGGYQYCQLSIGVCFVPNTGSGIVFFKRNKRVVPTLAFSGGADFRVNTAAANLVGTGISGSVYSPFSCSIFVTCSSLPAGIQNVIDTGNSNGKIYVDARL